MSATMHPSFAPPPILSAEDAADFYGLQFDSLRLCEVCDGVRGVRDRAIPGWDETERLRECGAEDCDGVLLDLSRNRSKRFCSQRCANRTNMTAYRRRQASDTDERPDSAAGA